MPNPVNINFMNKLSIALLNLFDLFPTPPNGINFKPSSHLNFHNVVKMSTGKKIDILITILQLPQIK